MESEGDRQTVVARVRAWLRPREDQGIAVELPCDDSPESDRQFLTSYWTTQQQRIGAHETARFQFSAFVIAGSLVAIGLIGNGSLTYLGQILSGTTVGLINFIAIRFVVNELRWIKVHQARASVALRRINPDVATMQRLANKRWYAREESMQNAPRATSSEMLCLVHIIILLASLVVAWAPHH